MRTDRSRWSRVVGSAVTVIALLAAGAVASGEPGAISYRVTPSAKITKVSYYLDKYKGSETVFFEIAVKNMSDQPKRFRVFVDIPDGPSAAYYYPLAGKPPVLKPGQEVSEKLPLVMYDRLPSAFSLAVDEIEAL